MTNNTTSAKKLTSGEIAKLRDLVAEMFTSIGAAISWVEDADGGYHIALGANGGPGILGEVKDLIAERERRSAIGKFAKKLGDVWGNLNDSRDALQEAFTLLEDALEQFEIDLADETAAELIKDSLVNYGAGNVSVEVENFGCADGCIDVVITTAIADDQLRDMLRDMLHRQMLYGRDMLDWVSINVSARQFNDPSLLLETLSEINDSGFPLDRLKLEITESAVMRSPELTRTVLGELQDVGIRVALDDFGTGYSALGALRHYSVDTIKIDRDFTKRLDTDDGRELVLALLKIARIYGAAVVAEGVETAVQQEILREAACDYGQGYLFAKPMGGSLFGAYALTHLVEGVSLEELAAD